jgi:hypothetical protein
MGSNITHLTFGIDVDHHDPANKDTQTVELATECRIRPTSNKDIEGEGRMILAAISDLSLRRRR